MKKMFFFLVLASLFTGLSVAANEYYPNHPYCDWARHPTVSINGELLEIPEGEQRPTIFDDRTLVPLRAISEAMGFSIEWNAQMQRASLTKPDYDISVQIGNNTILVNEATIPLDVPAQIINGRTMLPLRAIAEATGMEVFLNHFINRIYILEPFPPLEYWPEHLPKHIPGSVTLNPRAYGLRHWSDPPMRFRHAFYGVPFEVHQLVDSYASYRSEWWTQARDSCQHAERDINQLMHFVQYFNISREDFDAAIERMRAHSIRMGRDFTDEMGELPNADIIFTFDNDIIRYFYRRE